MDEDEIGLKGAIATTNVNQSDSSNKIYHSEYGDYSVSVKIAHTNEKRELLFLAHEFGHVRYQVPNISTYAKYYRQTYLNRYYDCPEKGHFTNDPSLKSVQAILKEYKKSLKQHVKNLKNTREDLEGNMLVNRLPR